MKMGKVMKQDFISVVMSTYNEPEKLLRQAIESIINQTYENFEFIIILDNPYNNEILRVVEEYALQDHRIRMIRHQKNQGLTRSLNEGIKAAKGNLIARMDADDISAPARLEVELRALRERKLDLVAASKKNIDEGNQELGTFINDFSPKRIRKLLPYDNSINHPSVLVRKAVMKKLGGYREIASCEDYDLWIRMLCSGCRMAILPEVLLYYRVRKESITRTDKYKQYISERFIRKMYKLSRRKKRPVFLSEEEYQIFYENSLLLYHDKSRFNQAYAYLYCGFEALKLGNKKLCVNNIMKAIRTDRRMVNLILERVQYHVRKKVVCRFYKEKG